MFKGNIEEIIVRYSATFKSFNMLIARLSYKIRQEEKHSLTFIEDFLEIRAKLRSQKIFHFLTIKSRRKVNKLEYLKINTD